MKFKTEKGTLLEAIQKTQGIITPKATLPILSHILLETQQGTLKLTATDLDVGITCVIPVEVQEQGAITIPAKRFNDIIREFPHDTVSINTKKNNLVVIEAESCQFKILGLGREDFPKLPEIKESTTFKIDQTLLKQQFRTLISPLYFLLFKLT